MMESGWHIRHYREGDIPAIVALANAVNIAEGNDERATEADLQRFYYYPGRDPLRHILVVDGPAADGVPDGMLLGSGRVFPAENPDTNECTYELALRVHAALKESDLHRHLA